MEHDEESQFSVTTLDEEETAVETREDDRTVSTLASEKDPRLRHLGLSASRRSSLQRKHNSRRSIGASAVNSQNTRSQNGWTEATTVEDSATGLGFSTPDCDKYGNKRLSAGPASRRSSRRTSIGSSGSVLSESQPGAYYVENSDEPPDLEAGGDSEQLDDIPLHNGPSLGVLVEASLVEDSPKFVPPVVEAAPIDERKRGVVVSFRSILCLVAAIGIIVVPLTTGLIVALKSGRAPDTIPSSTSRGIDDGPSVAPNPDPTSSTTNAPTTAPTLPSKNESLWLDPSLAPTQSPPTKTAVPSLPPSTQAFGLASTNPPTMDHSSTAPSTNPSTVPTELPTAAPSEVSSKSPTSAPTNQPSLNPTVSPTSSPTLAPSENPSTVVATSLPSIAPTEAVVAFPPPHSNAGGNGNGNGNGKDKENNGNGKNRGG